MCCKLLALFCRRHLWPTTCAGAVCSSVRGRRTKSEVVIRCWRGVYCSLWSLWSFCIIRVSPKKSCCSLVLKGVSWGCLGIWSSSVCWTFFWHIQRVGDNALDSKCPGGAAKCCLAEGCLGYIAEPACTTNPTSNKRRKLMNERVGMWLLFFK